MLFEPIKVGHMDLAHRVVLAPLTRLRNSEDNLATDNQVTYYQQRAADPGTLLISEATPVRPEAGAKPRLPGIWTEEQAQRWKKVTSAVHNKKSYIFMQLWAFGRKARGPTESVAPSDLELDDGNGLGKSKPRELTRAEILQYVQWFASAAKNAVETAEFDGVEIHSANGYLIEQFMRSATNHRTDEYGGSVENRTLLARQIVDAVVAAVGDAKKVGIRLSPWTRSGDWGPSSSTLSEYSYLLSYLQDAYPDLAYVSIVEPRVANGHWSDDVSVPHITSLGINDWNSFVRLVWQGVLIRAGGFISHDGKDDGAALAQTDPKLLIAYGRYFISNPDLPRRLKNNVKLIHYDRATFYTEGPKGYTDYPFS